MSKLSVLREALEKLDAAETALLDACEAFANQGATRGTYTELDKQYEVVGDAATTVRDILAYEERSVLQAKKSEKEQNADKRTSSTTALLARTRQN